MLKSAVRGCRRLTGSTLLMLSFAASSASFADAPRAPARTVSHPPAESLRIAAAGREARDSRWSAVARAWYGAGLQGDLGTRSAANPWVEAHRPY